MIDYVAAVGDAGDIRCWSGTPFHCLEAARRLGWATKPWRLPLGEFKWPRRAWNVRQLVSGRGVGGYQYSSAFLERAESRFASEIPGKCILSFHHQFPRAATVHGAGGKIIYYLDATLGAMLEGHALPLRLPRGAARRAAAIERENLAEADQVITMARWLRDYLVERGHVRENRISVIMPGANLSLPEAWTPPARGERGPREPFVLGLVGNDWERKGLPFLVEVVRILQQAGTPARIRVIGDCPKNFDPGTTDVMGVIDKGKALSEFVSALAGCDLGCLFSKKEAFGISILEFLRIGVPVAGFAHEGPADSIPLDAGLRFPSGTSARSVAEALGKFIGSPGRRRLFDIAAAAWSPRVTWERCLREMAELVVTGQDSSQVRPWMGLETGGAQSDEVRRNFAREGTRV